MGLKFLCFNNFGRMDGYLHVLDTLHETVGHSRKRPRHGLETDVE
jgi:hypothetical protein